MKTKIMIYVCFTLLTLSLVSCGIKGNVVGDVDDPSAPYEPESYAELQISTIDGLSQPQENDEHSSLPKYYDVDPSEAEELQRKCQEIALLCNDLMVNGESETSLYFPYDTTLTQSAVDDIEVLLAEAGYPVLNSDSKYPTYLENSDGLKHFFELAGNGENAQQSVVNVSSYNSIYYLTFQYADNTMYYINTAISWDEDGKFTISDPYGMETIAWGMTNGYFYYQMYRVDPHWSACASIRLEPTDKELYDLYTDYLTPVGYPSRVFTLDWDKSSYENICFNDLLEPLYMERYGEHVYSADYEFYSDMQCSLIPADMFENTILPHFDISLDEFRKLTLYMRESNTYPWQMLNCSNIIFCPELTPEVVARRDNGDGTFTIVVDVLCFDYKYFPYFTHEITIRPNSDGGFQYVANQVTYTCEHGVPDTTPRLVAQRK